MSICKNLSVRLNQFKEDNDLSFAEMAELLQMPLSSVQNYCSEKVNPRTDTVERISELTKISMVELVFGKPTGEEFLKTVSQFAKLAGGLSLEERRKAFEAFRESIGLSTDNPLN